MIPLSVTGQRIVRLTSNAPPCIVVHADEVALLMIEAMTCSPLAWSGVRIVGHLSQENQVTGLQTADTLIEGI